MTEAVRNGYSYIEIDVHATSDGVVIVLHDATLDRVSDVAGKVSSIPWSQVQSAKVGGKGAVSTLEEVLAALPSARFNIDVKTDSAVDPFVDLIERTQSHGRISIASFSTRRLSRLRRKFQRRGGVPAAAFSPAGVAAVWALSRTPWSQKVPLGGLRRVAWGDMAQVPRTYRGRTLVDDRFVALVHRLGAEVHVWTVDDDSDMRALLDIGVDGIVTDRPDVLIDVLRERGQWQKP
ncbi:glycerophosphoryl diester phosphodiesterase [Hoyosella rhizosphaerae]|uniref:Glycerophosphoryl diester phosphodiesterase n=2 Tax=Hoyosella rhizosphaerae TaxID=1755582 RepID=A0A916X9M0_9ACTN|nr:glycerophosphoryl diester phosphodiesterase [Hoyosella rhizosphaerae]